MQKKKYFLRTFLCLALFSISYFLTTMYVLYHERVAKPDRLHGSRNPNTPGYLSCYYAEEKGKIQVINNAPKPSDSIFFHETRCQLTLHLREACSVESAARTHPNRQVYVVFSRAVEELDLEWKSGVLALLATIPNVHFYRVNLNTYAQDTPLQSIFSPGLTWLAKWHYRKIGELLKFLTLYKFGGTVIDLDVMVVDAMDELGNNWASKMGDGVESGIISLSHGLAWKLYAEEFLKALKHQMASDGGSSAESALADAYKSLCNSTDEVKITRKRCKGFRVYSDEFFNPGDRWNHNVTEANISAGYLGYHLWDEINERHRTSMPSDSLYVSLARRHCPLVFNMFMSTQIEPIVHL